MHRRTPVHGAELFHLRRIPVLPGADLRIDIRVGGVGSTLCDHVFGPHFLPSHTLIGVF